MQWKNIKLVPTSNIYKFQIDSNWKYKGKKYQKEKEEFLKKQSFKQILINKEEVKYIARIRNTTMLSKRMSNPHILAWKGLADILNTKNKFGRKIHIV